MLELAEVPTTVTAVVRGKQIEVTVQDGMKFIRRKDAALVAGKSETTIQRWMSDGTLTPVHVGDDPDLRGSYIALTQILAKIRLQVPAELLAFEPEGDR